MTKLLAILFTVFAFSNVSFAADASAPAPATDTNMPAENGDMNKDMKKGDMKKDMKKDNMENTPATDANVAK